MSGDARVKIAPFRVPNYVLVAPEKINARREWPSLRLGDLEDDVLTAMCDEFKAGVLKRAVEQRAELRE